MLTETEKMRIVEEEIYKILNIRDVMEDSLSFHDGEYEANDFEKYIHLLNLQKENIMTISRLF